MNLYYESLFKEIDTLLVGGHIDKVRGMLEEELRMPYIPEDVEVRLKDYLNQCSVTKEQSVQYFTDFESIRSSLLRNDALIVKALESLGRLNVRQHVGAISDVLLDDNITDDIKRHILMILMDQDVNQSFSVLMNDQRHELSISTLKNPFDTSHFHDILKQCQARFDKNPSLLELAIQEVCRCAHAGFPLEMDKYNMESIENSLKSYMDDLF